MIADQNIDALRTYNLFGSLKKEGEQNKGRESNSITLFRSFIKKWRRDLEGFQLPLTPHF